MVTIIYLGGHQPIYRTLAIKKLTVNVDRSDDIALIITVKRTYILVFLAIIKLQSKMLRMYAGEHRFSPTYLQRSYPQKEPSFSLRSVLQLS